MKKSLFKDDHALVTPFAIVLLGIAIVLLLCVGLALLLPPNFIIQP
jgi:hypothetical protein